MAQTGQPTDAAPLADEHRQKLAEIVTREGSVRAAARVLVLPRMTVLRAHEGERLRAGTRALIESALSKE